MDIKINTQKLLKELTDAGIPVDGCSSSGRIDFAKEASKKQKEQAHTILESHDPALYYYKRKKAYPAIEEQLDYIYHNGIEAWKKDVIDPIKEKYPKN